LEVAAVALKPRWSTTPIKAAADVFFGSNETRAEPTATSSTFVPGIDFSAVDTFEAQPPQCIPRIDRFKFSMTDSKFKYEESRRQSQRPRFPVMSASNEPFVSLRWIYYHLKESTLQNINITGIS
jgi:hypothetical protein